MFPQISVQGLHHIGCSEDIPETKTSLQENALDKARYVHQKYGCNCFADDTGLEIDALNGQPGVFSARYAGPEKDSQANVNKVLQQMQHQQNRSARFRTVIALILDKEELIFEGVAEGEIITQKRGKEGFGYDPVFIPQGYTKTFAEMPIQQKNLISHRFKAMQMLKEYLTSQNYL